MFWQVVSRTKSPQEILDEYEKLKEEREQRRLEQQTNPRGSLIVGVDAANLFQRYPAFDTTGYRYILFLGEK